MPNNSISSYNVRKITSLDDSMALKYINDNFQYLKLKIFGNLIDDDLYQYAEISGSKIKAGSISAKQIAADYIYSGKIDAKQITGESIDGINITSKQAVDSGLKSALTYGQFKMWDETDTNASYVLGIIGMNYGTYSHINEVMVTTGFDTVMQGYLNFKYVDGISPYVDLTIRANDIKINPYAKLYYSGSEVATKSWAASQSDLQNLADYAGGLETRIAALESAGGSV